MAKGLFILGTGTDVGKTYVSALLVKCLVEAGYQAGYYKAAQSGAASLSESDAGWVKAVSGTKQETESMVSYSYQTPVSPHLAARLEGGYAHLSVIQSAFAGLCRQMELVTVEGSGGMICPLVYEPNRQLMLLDVIQALRLPVLLVSTAALGSINQVVLTAQYAAANGISLRGILINRYHGGRMEEDNCRMMETLTGLPILGYVAEGAKAFPLPAEVVSSWYGAAD